MPKDLEQSNIIRPKMPGEFDWWIEICTDNPSCIYYFGSFDSFASADLAQHGYILDLLEEGAKIRSVKIEKCQPQQLTIVVSKTNCLNNIYHNKSLLNP